MKMITLSLLGAASLLAQPAAPVTSATLDESEVRITYGELRRLVAAGQAQETPAVPKPVAPVPAALLSSVYEWDVKAGVITADMQVENFEGGWHVIPLAGAGAGALSVEPRDARLVTMDDRLGLVTDKTGAQAVRLSFASDTSGQGAILHLAASPVAVLTVKEWPEGKVLQVQHATATRMLAVPGPVPLPAAGGEVTLHWEDGRKGAPPPAAATTDGAIITTASYTTQVVRDGSVLTEGALTVRHDEPVRLVLRLPEKSRLLQCHVNGEAARPKLGAEGQVEVPLDDLATDGAESEVRLSFTAAFAPLQAAEGEMELALPATPLFARQIDWNVQLPDVYDLAFSGNVDAIIDKAATPGLHLRKSLCRDQQPQARVIYRKHASN